MNQKTCMRLSKSDIVALCNKYNISSEGTKETLCKRLQLYFDNIASSSSSSSSLHDDTSAKRSKTLTSLTPEIISETFVTLPVMKQQLQYIQQVQTALPRCTDVAILPLSSSTSSTSTTSSSGLVSYTMDHAIAQMLQISSKSQPARLFRRDDVMLQTFMQCYVRDVFQTVGDKMFVSGEEGIPILTKDIEHYMKWKKIGSDSIYGSAFLTYAMTPKGPVSTPFGIKRLFKWKMEKAKQHFLRSSMKLQLDMHAIRSEP